MARLTLTLPDDLHRALKETAARRGTTIASLVAESLEFYGIKSTADARQLVARARQQAALDQDAALELAVSETRQARAR